MVNECSNVELGTHLFSCSDCKSTTELIRWQRKTRHAVLRRRRRRTTHSEFILDSKFIYKIVAADGNSTAKIFYSLVRRTFCVEMIHCDSRVGFGCECQRTIEVAYIYENIVQRRTKNSSPNCPAAAVFASALPEFFPSEN